MTDQQDRFAKRLVGHLEDDCQLDGATASRLRQAREAALEQLDARARRRRQWFAGGMVSATALALVVGILVGGGSAVISEQTVDVIDIVAAQDGLDMYQDMEFYDWLSEQRSRAG